MRPFPAPPEARAAVERAGSRETAPPGRGFAPSDMDEQRARDEGARWMAAWQAGDAAAFERIVDGYSGRLYSLFTRFLGPTEEREDLVQETFLRVLRARDAYRPTARFSTWLYRIAFNLAVNRTERARPHRSLPTEERGRAADRERVEELEPGQDLEREETVRAVRQAIASLPEAQRMALVLARYEGLSLAEIAEVVGSTEKAVKSLVHRAREKLRERLAPFLREVAP